ncbi:MAG: hydrogenase [Elusimicrobia bacterium]|nr:hydrogenase [Elusimicrobiota bacterium]
MSTLAELTIVFIILLNLALAVSGSMSVCIRLAAIQGVAAGLLPLLAGGGVMRGRAMAFAAFIILLKGAVFPWLMFRAREKTGARRDVDPLIGYPSSIMLCLGAFAASSWLGSRLPLPHSGVAFIVPASLATIFTGFLLITTRAKAITQVLGYLVIENGIYIFGLALFVEQPLMVELAILLDVFVAVFVMGIAIFHISREFDHIDTDQMDELTDWHQSEEGGNI